jgi:hypothetical protein
VYLVPLGLEGESLDWAPTYYKSKFGIGVTVLPSVPLESGLVDSDRGQVDADKCLDDFIRLKYPDLSRDPSALLLVVTSHDLYSPRLGGVTQKTFATKAGSPSFRPPGYIHGPFSRS